MSLKIRNDGAFNTIVATEGIFTSLSSMTGIAGGNIGGIGTFAAIIPNAVFTLQAASGAISVSNYGTTLSSALGPLAMTLADGTVNGQLKEIDLVPGATVNGATITLATAAGGASQDVITLTPPAIQITASTTLQWTPTGWRVIRLVNGTLA